MDNMADWHDCDHDWEEIDSQFSNERFTEVRCKRCECPGQMDNRTGTVTWPAT